MSQFFNIHSENPQNRLVVQVADCLKQGGVVVYPTDACYAIGCSLDNKRGMDRIRRIRQLKEDHEFTLALPRFIRFGLVRAGAQPRLSSLKASDPGPLYVHLGGQQAGSKTIGAAEAQNHWVSVCRIIKLFARF